MILVLGVMITGMTIAAVAGGEAIASSQGQLDVSRAEAAMTQLDSQTAMVALGGATGQVVELPGAEGGQYAVRPDAGRVSVEYVDFADGTREHVVRDRRLGAVVFENDQGSIAYQGGGVWRRTGASSVMVSPPEFHYRNATLTFPLVTVAGDRSLADTASITANGTTRYYPNRTRDPDYANPLQGGQVTVTIQSDYYRGWATYFETRTGGEVSIDPDDRTVSLDLVVPGENPPVEGGIVTAPSGELTIKQHASADSYNSSEGPYGSFPDGENTAIVADADVTVSNHADLYGDLVADGTVTVENHGTVHGNVSHSGLDLARHGHVDGWTVRNASATPPSTVDGEITDRVDAYRSRNDNANASVDVDETADRLENCDSVCRLLPGDYYLEEIDLDDDDRLLLDTRNGSIDVAVDGPVTADGDYPGGSDPEIRVIGDGRANLYANESITFQNSVGVDVVGDRAPMFWTYTRSDESVSFGNHVRFEGVIYGPGPAGTPGTDVSLANHAAVYGGLVGDVTFVNNHYAIHYDEALTSVDPISVETSVPALTYLHVTENRLNVTSR